MDEVILKIPEIIEQLVEQHDSQENDDSTLRRSTRERNSAIPSNYVVYLEESNFNVGAVNDPEIFSQVMVAKNQIYGLIP